MKQRFHENRDPRVTYSRWKRSDEGEGGGAGSGMFS